MVSLSYDFVEAKDTGLCDADYLGMYFQGNDFEIMPTYGTTAYPDSRMRFYLDEISSGETITTPLYFGATGYSDQYTSTYGYPWMASSNDTCTITDDNTLDFDNEYFYMSAFVNLLSIPSSGTHSIISKPGNYNLYLDATGSPTYSFKIWSATGTESTVSLDAEVDGTMKGILAWYDHSYIIISDGSTQDYLAASGTLAVNSNDLHVCEIDAVIDELKIYKYSP